MCGIYFSLSRVEARQPDSKDLENLRARGPHALQTIERSGPQDNYRVDAVSHLIFSSSVLALRGDKIQSQPLVDDTTGSVLCWNGEAWKFDGDRIDGNDTHRVFRELCAAVASGDLSQGISNVLTKITGPFAFVFYDALHSTVYYGRDRLGRRSLIQQQPDADSLVLCSVASETVNSADEVSSTSLHALTLNGLRSTYTQLSWNEPLTKIDKSIAPNHPPAIPSNATVSALSSHLSASLQLRVTNIPNHDRRCLPSEANIAILFSGGLDCTLLARMTHDLLPLEEQIDLLNVAFENPRTLRSSTNDSASPYEICPDRITGRKSFTELANVCPQRIWRFVTIDIPYSVMLEHKPKIIKLMRPHNTEMDLSIAAALYFAARASGNAITSADLAGSSKPYTSPARVLISGLGADELFAGYSRHAAAFARGGFADLTAELELDFQRIGSRNLGRDDRVMSHWGKEIRYPYLDEDFIDFALSLPVWEKCGFRADRPILKHYETPLQVSNEYELDSAKMLLRLAAWRSGMTGVAAERKRAIQFGARTAKMESGGGRKKGTDLLE